MREYVGCKTAKEISKVKNPANKLSTHLVAKSDKNPTPENTEMADQAEVQKAATAIANKLFAMNDVTKSHYLALDEAAQTSFLEKSAEDMAKEAEAAKKAKDEAAAAAELEKSGKSAREAELEKSNKDLQARVEDLEKRDKDRAQDAEVEKRARDEFKGYPGGPEKLVPLLKSFAKLPDAERTAAEAVLKSQADMATRSGNVVGLRSEEDIAKAQPATAKIEKAAKERAKEKGTSFQQAYSEMSREKAWADDFAAADAEESAAA